LKSLKADYQLVMGSLWNGARELGSQNPRDTFELSGSYVWAWNT